MSRCGRGGPSGLGRVDSARRTGEDVQRHRALGATLRMPDAPGPVASGASGQTSQPGAIGSGVGADHVGMPSVPTPLRLAAGQSGVGTARARVEQDTRDHLS